MGVSALVVPMPRRMFVTGQPAMAASLMHNL